MRLEPFDPNLPPNALASYYYTNTVKSSPMSRLLVTFPLASLTGLYLLQQRKNAGT
jgi:hypothetical protein